MKVAVWFNWDPVGEVRLVGDDLVFPTLPDTPSIYRFEFIGGREVGTYIGEATQLRRRAYLYRRPGPSQHTNIRMNAAMWDHLARIHRTSPSDGSMTALDSDSGREQVLDQGE